MPIAHQPMADLNRALRSTNDADAFSAFLFAARAGCLRAQSLVGLAYHTGRGVAVDFERAAEWYCKAAAGGDSYAMANLGMMSLLGQGMAADDVDAYVWLQSAVGLGHRSLRPAVAMLERRIAGRDAAGRDGILTSVAPQRPGVRPCAMAVCDPSRCEAE
jgi:TPR repeat protein